MNNNKKGPLVDKQISNTKIQTQNKLVKQNGKQVGKSNITKPIKKQNDQMLLSRGKSSTIIKNDNMKKQKVKQVSNIKTNIIEKTNLISNVIDPTMKQTKIVNRNMKSTMTNRFQQAKNLQLVPCNTCARTFIPQSLKRHEKICKKVFVNKRKEFNSVKQRMVSKEQVKLLKLSNIKQVKQNTKNKINAMPLWKQQSLAFRLAMKEVRGAKKSQQQMAFQQKEKKMVRQNMFKCKGCSRFFNDEAGKRHEPFCLQKLKKMPNKQIKR